MKAADIIHIDKTQPGEMPGNHTEQLLDKVKREIADYSLTQGEVSKEAGLSKTSTGSKLNQWLQGKYPGDNSKLEVKLERWLLSRADRRSITNTLPSAPEWFDGTTSKKVLNTLRFTQMEGGFSYIIGGAGLSKTSSAKHHAKHHPNVWLATMSPTSSSVGGFLRRIIRTLGITGIISRNDDLEHVIIERLSDTSGLLIIDEAQHLNHSALHSVQYIQDATETGIALMGNEIIYTQLTGGRRAAEFAQLFSRIGKGLRLNKASAGDIRALANAWQIEGKEELHLLSEIAKRPGALRGVTRTLRLASMFSQGLEIKVQHIRAAWKDLGGEV